ncbi:MULTISPECIES: RNA polymerase sigma factor SigF [Actinoalloteichus]|uniref:RNA polymerase, sigma 28 subunit, SigD/FliA/WhiG n=1 Tax=Actinoalloteichus fjordicus TaxID=1612552 RepID=A0AAC9LDK9_9PSEU|nr:MULTISPECIES: RNA polymerase sigma factor SigF [Actinoalloteichus]APU14410.1 RNA polymerase, sigma 28 subunit, SigD/FliA/WhiG [Actinoalloteichus fjordicus]APU20379.1 RNA polymerase, sigma 28 subunit, SigD/FliA/WhiG [Actinoalloteichus sp. GBA129-24]
MTQRSPVSSRDHTYEHLLPLFATLTDLSEGDPRRTTVREKLITEHQALALHIAQRFSNRGVAMDDLVQVANVGLIQAVDRFDPARGTDFLAFAVPTIMGEVRRYFRDRSWSVHLPRRLKELHLAINAVVRELSQSLGRAPTSTEIADRLGISREEVIEGLEVRHAYRSSSLDEVLGDEDSPSLSSTLGAEDPEMAVVENREALHPLLASLPERERTVLLLRFFGNMTQTQISERVGVSQMHVSRILAKTLRHLREQLGDS